METTEHCQDINAEIQETVIQDLLDSIPVFSMMSPPPTPHTSLQRDSVQLSIKEKLPSCLKTNRRRSASPKPCRKISQDLSSVNNSYAWFKVKTMTPIPSNGSVYTSIAQAVRSGRKMTKKYQKFEDYPEPKLAKPIPRVVRKRKPRGKSYPG